MKGVSVIICCYNSALRLPETLKYISRQKVSGLINWEVIIVNNLSTDNTAEVAAAECTRYKNDNLTFKIADQPIAGLSFAREKGVETAAYDYLVFCDDDNWLDENYIENAFNLMELWPTAGIIGGRGIAKPEVDPPDWFETYSGYYATGAQNGSSGIMKGDSPYVYGAGAVIRKSVLKKLDDLGFKPIATDRLNNTLSSGGDVELSYAVKLIGYDIAYSDELKFFHFIQKNRLTNRYLIQLAYHFGYCNILHRPYFWIFNPQLLRFKKTWVWTLIISLHIYLVSFFNLLKKRNSPDNFIAKVNVSHAKGRFAAILKSRSEIEKACRSISRKFNTIPRSN